MPSDSRGIWNGPVQESIDCLCDNREDSIRRGGKWSVVHLHSKHVASCTMGHEPLSLGCDHAISLCHQKPRWHFFPRRLGHLLLYAPGRDGTLRCRHQQSIVGGTLMSDRIKSAAGDEDLDPLAGHATSIAPRQARSLCCPQRVILL